MRVAESIEEIRNIIAENMKVVLFIGDAICSSSGALSNKLEALSKKHKDVVFLQTVLAAMPALAGEYMVFTAPALIVFKDGKEVFREGRFLEFEKLEDYL